MDSVEDSFKRYPVTDSIGAVHWLCRNPTTYNAILFRRLSKEGGASLHIHYLSSKNDSGRTNADLLKGYDCSFWRPFWGIDMRLISLAWNGEDQLWVSGSWNDPTSWLCLSIRALRGLPYWVWTDTPDPFRHRPLVRGMLRKLWLKWVLGNAALVLGTGKASLEVLSDLGCPKEKLRNFPYFIDVASYSGHRQKNSLPILLSAGKLIPRKRYDLALQSLSKVPGPWQYFIAGEGPERIRLEKLAQTLGLKNRAKFVGWKNPKQLKMLFRKSDIFIHPARFEPYGVVVLEAMASGCAVIASNRTMAARDRIQNGKQGLIFAWDNSQELTKKINDLLKHPGKPKKMGSEARKVASAWPLDKAASMFRSYLKKTESESS